MQTGLIVAILSGLAFSIGIIIVRKASAEAGESFSVMAISIMIGMPFFALAVTIAGDWGKVAAVSWRALALLVPVGIIHFIIGRLAGYGSYRRIGANKATPFIMTNQFYTLLFSFLFLGETITVYIIGGIICMFLGAAFTSAEKKTVTIEKEKKFFTAERKGILLALGAALCWGTTPVLIKPGVAAMGSSVAAGFISYCAAGVVLLAMFLKKPLRQQVTQLPVKRCLVPMTVAALFTSTGQMLNYVALGFSPANVVTPLISTQVIFIFLLSWAFNRRAEVISWKIGVGMAAALVGSFLLFR